ncbi:DUF1190 domain-containing protein [Jiella sonneratiae]|uniref:DUF1190 domain-containing protein n=1 Tax=Jiella sonneratiae TaxID=2816856 RepID=A0ABS3J8Z4_9HYPH|nr:DUF1190 domain-containing protein [Jiella sonneratiae]MBO0905587.1 DUF1190 domain-containing protein [Jiella sonneratiae]
MKRRFTRRTPPILTLGTIAATGMVLYGCGDDQPKEMVFSTPQQCADAGVDMQICEAEYQQALQKHLTDAPHYASLQECEAAMGAGRCFQAGNPGNQNAAGQTSGSGTGFFVPFMTGYLVSSAISSLSNYSAYRDYRYSSGYVSTPIYTNRAGDTLTSTVEGGKSVSRPVNVNTRTVSRSGFGGRSSSRGGGFFGG